ncbi:hypothetical protein V7182_11930 [Neobacillus drentensis]|uniref:hypothetical protein n=1 Tax=Neobacillus drentensis TaxID=220684 RepID=UPI0030006891
MSFRYDMQNKTPEQQAIVRQRDKEDELTKKEAENKRISNKIISFLEIQSESKNKREIAENIKVEEPDVLRILNNLVKQKKVEMGIQFNEETKVNMPYYSVVSSILNKVGSVNNLLCSSVSGEIPLK